MKFICIVFSLVGGLISCKSKSPGNVNYIVSDSVRAMAASIERDLSTRGAVAWIKYFQRSPGFFMASDGKLVFPDNKHADDFINDTLSKSMSRLELKWKDIRVDSLGPELAMMSASFNEFLTDISGNKIPVDGFFTGLVQHSSNGWQLRNAHWSLKK